MPKIGQIRPLIRSVCVLIDRSLFIHYYYYYYSNPHTICYHHFLTTYYNVSTFYYYYYYTYLLQYYIKKVKRGRTFLPNIFSYYSQCERMDGDPNVSALLRSFSCSSVPSMVEFKGQ